MKLFKNIFIQPKSLIFIFITTAVIVISSVLIELSQSKKEMTQLMEKHARTLLESLLSSSENALLSYERIEDEIIERLLNNAQYVNSLYKKGMLSNSVLKSIADENEIYRINIFNKVGKKIYSNHEEVHTEISKDENPISYIQPILDGDLDTLIIGIKKSRIGDENRFAVAIASYNGGAIVVNIDAKDLLEFRKQVGFGALLQNIAKSNQIEFVALQDEDGIIAASGKLTHLESIDSSEFLKDVINNQIYKWRIAEVDSVNLFEAVLPFKHYDELIGIFRIGLSLEPLNQVNERITRRILFLALVLLVFGFITFSLIFVRQNFTLLKDRFSAIESYSKKIIDNVSDAIVVLNCNLEIISSNEAANKILTASKSNIVGQSLYSIFDKDKCNKIINSSSRLKEIECTINGVTKIFLLSKSEFENEKKELNIILVLRDLTEMKKLEEQIQRKERLTAMGELASTVAHEIRNPLNTIGTITQQLGKDFEPKKNVDEFSKLTLLVYKEVRRINDTIENFLKFAKPQPINPTKFTSSEIFVQLEKQYSKLLSEKNIKFKFTENWKDFVVWDKAQITQVFINLMQNAIDAINNNGLISITISELTNSNIEIIFSDNGNGISPTDIHKIFNLYFTTKSKGSGIGLSIVHQIIAEHNGMVNVKSELGKGTSFIIALPKVCK